MLFPEFAPLRNLVGIAKLAAEGDVLATKRRVDYRDLETRRFIGRASGRKMPFDWTINPYRGCEFGCKYCYARFTHEFMELRDTEQFEREIYAKRFNSDSFRRELTRIPAGDGICLGTATDPYQPAERKFEVTRKILSVFAGERGRTLSITTKSDLCRARYRSAGNNFQAQRIARIRDGHNDGRTPCAPAGAVCATSLAAAGEHP